MQITLNQDEIEDSIRAHVMNQIVIREDQEVSIDLRAGRGENGFTATLDIRTRTTGKPTKTAPSGFRTPVEPSEPKLTRSIVDAAPPEPEAPAEPAKPVTIAKSKDQAETPKKGIFAAVATPPAADPYADEDEVPGEETPAEEEARADAAADAGEAPAEAPKKGSIFNFNKPQKTA